MTDEIRPTYFVEYDEICKNWCIYVHEKHSDSTGSAPRRRRFFIAEFDEEKHAIAIQDCMNDMMMRIWK